MAEQVPEQDPYVRDSNLRQTLGSISPMSLWRWRQRGIWPEP